MNFGPIFRSFIKSVYNNVSSCVLNNGYKSRSFPLQRGVRQGCPLSPLLYCLVAETLGNKIRKNSKISGLHLPGTNAQAKISQYADGTTIFATDPRSVVEAMRSVKTFKAGSGSKVNLSVGKSEGIWFGKHYGCNESLVEELNWETGDTEILGIPFGSQEAILAAWSKRTDKLEQKLQAWSNRSLSLHGKVMIINSLGLSGLVYLASVYQIPSLIVTRVNKIVFNFLWSGKAELVKQGIIFQPRSQGGLGLCNIVLKSQALLLRSVAKITASSCETKWAYLERY